MKYLTLEHIRQHLRIDFVEEDAVLELYGSAAEDVVLQVCERTIDDIIETYGGIPDAIRQATLLLVGQSYIHREPASTQNISSVPYAFDLLIKPYMRLASKTGGCPHRKIQTAVLGSDIKIEFWSGLPDDLTMLDVPFTVTVYNEMAVNAKIDFIKEECILTDEGDYVVLVDTEKLGVGLVKLKVTFQIPDKDFPTGYRKEVVRINPYIRITG